MEGFGIKLERALIQRLTSCFLQELGLEDLDFCIIEQYKFTIWIN